MKTQIFALTLLSLAALSTTVFISGCGSSAGQEDTSSSGSVGGTLGGTFASTSGGTSSAFFMPKTQASKLDVAQLFNFFIPKANASTACPIIATGGSGCSGGATATLTYSNCSFAGSSAVWNGSQSVAFTGATATCGSAFPTTMSQIVRTFGASTTRTSAAGSVVTIDTSGAVTAADTNTYSGGITVTFNGSGTRTGLSIGGIDLVSPGHFSHTITTAAGGSTLTFANGNTITSGTVIVFHNLAKVKGTSVISNLQFSPTCCLPISGSITTTFSTISGVTPLIKGFNGVSESITYNGCGLATYQGPEGYGGPVTLGHCI